MYNVEIDLDCNKEEFIEKCVSKLKDVNLMNYFIKNHYGIYGKLFDDNILVTTFLTQNDVANKRDYILYGKIIEEESGCKLQGVIKTSKIYKIKCILLTLLLLFILSKVNLFSSISILFFQGIYILWIYKYNLNNEFINQMLNEISSFIFQTSEININNICITDKENNFKGSVYKIQKLIAIIFLAVGVIGFLSSFVITLKNKNINEYNENIQNYISNVPGTLYNISEIYVNDENIIISSKEEHSTQVFAKDGTFIFRLFMPYDFVLNVEINDTSNMEVYTRKNHSSIYYKYIVDIDNQKIVSLECLGESDEEEIDKSKAYFLDFPKYENSKEYYELKYNKLLVLVGSEKKVINITDFKMMPLPTITYAILALQGFVGILFGRKILISEG